MSREKYRKMYLFQMKAIVSVSVKQFYSANESRVKQLIVQNVKCVCDFHFCSTANYEQISKSPLLLLDMNKNAPSSCIVI